MATKVHHIHLSAEERVALEQIIASNHRSAREKKRARMLLFATATPPLKKAVLAAMSKSRRSLNAVRTRCINYGGARPKRTCVVVRAVQKNRVSRKLDGAKEARVALHHPGCPNQTPSSLSSTTPWLDHYQPGAHVSRRRLTSVILLVMSL